MPLELFHELVPFLRHTDLVYLQGWGEPLLNRDLFEMVRICKTRGNRVGFTTNGMLLTEDTIRSLVDLELDILGISLAGTTAGTHNRIREGTDLNQVISHLERLREIKAQENTRQPAVHLAYLMLRSNFHELDGVLDLAKRVGAEQVVASNLTLVVDPKLSAEALFNDTERTDHYWNALENLKQTAASEGIAFDYHGPGLDDTFFGCRENVHHACVISVEGEVIPCVLVNPVLDPDREIHAGMTFGNVRNESLTRIWNKKEYRGFRALFDPEMTRRSEQTRSGMPRCCMKCYKKLGA